MKRLGFFFLIICSLTLVNCTKPGCLESGGTVSTVKRSVTPFTQIHLYDNINLILTQEAEEAVAVEAGKHVQPNISTTVENGILTIRNNGSCNWLRDPAEKINVYVSFKTLKRLDYDGSGLVTSTNQLQADTITLYSYAGAGNINLGLKAKHTTVHLQGQNTDVTLNGSSDYCYTLIHPRGTIDLKAFEVKTMDVIYVGARDCTINVTDFLFVYVCHTGNVYYKGNPATIKPTYFSTGQLIKLP